jgi:predicted phosphodiesterase
MISFLGDIHGNVGALAAVENELKRVPAIKAIIQVGDYGWYPFLRKKFEEFKPDIPIYWIDGNHEDFTDLYDKTEVTEMAPNQFYVPRGTVLELDGKKVAFLGGAGSVDYRVNRHWDIREVISDEQFARLDAVESVDVLVTHTPPTCIIQKHFDPMDLVRYFGLSIDWRDPSADKVEALWKRLGCPLTLSGHMHRSVVDGTARILNIAELYCLP